MKIRLITNPRSASHIVAAVSWDQPIPPDWVEVKPIFGYGSSGSYFTHFGVRSPEYPNVYCACWHLKAEHGADDGPCNVKYGMAGGCECQKFREAK